MRTKFIAALALVIFMSAFLLPITAVATEDYDDDYYVEVTPPPPPVVGAPFTPDGVATVLENIVSDDKEFFTFETPAGNVFFLVIDRSRGQDNVYFLNAVTEQDLMALASSGNPVAPIPTTVPVLEPEPTPEEPTAPAAPEAQSNSNGTMIFIVIAVAVFGAAAYYFKIIRPKKQGTDFEEEEDEFGVKRVPLFEDEDEEDEM